MKIEDWRNEINEIDKMMIRLLNRRARLAIKVGTMKKTNGLPIFDAARERDVVQRVLLANNGPLDERAVRKIFRRIIHESRRVETEVVSRIEQPAEGVLL